LMMFDVLERYERLDREGRVRFLLSAAFNLTIEVRGLAELPDDLSRGMYYAANELQHKLLAHTLNEQMSRERYPNDVLFTVLSEVAARGNISNHWSAALLAAIDR
jgi:hypothetical protein